MGVVDFMNELLEPIRNNNKLKELKEQAYSKLISIKKDQMKY